MPSHHHRPRRRPAPTPDRSGCGYRLGQLLGALLVAAVSAVLVLVIVGAVRLLASWAL